MVTITKIPTIIIIDGPIQRPTLNSKAIDIPIRIIKRPKTTSIIAPS